MNLRILSTVAAVGLAAGPAMLSAAPLEKKVLIIGMDGTMPASLALARTPNLTTLKAGGCFSDRAVTHPVTHSAACWTAMFTGVWGDKNGVNDVNNGFYGTQFGQHPNFMKRLETVNSDWNTVALLRWSPLSTALGGTDVIQSFSSDATITSNTCWRLTNSNPDVLFTILLDVDSAGHSPGWFTTNYIQAIETADARVGQMLGALTNRANYANEDWLVIVLSDHGKHDDPDIEKSRVTFHLVWGRAAARGLMRPSPSIVDVCATVLTHMGVAVDPAWNLDARLEGLPLPPARYGTNLVFNGDAEFNSGTNNYYIREDHQNIDRGIAWWFDAGPVTLGQYGTHPNFPTVASPGPTHRGSNFFLGGIGTSNVISQVIALSDLGADVDDPGVDYVLSGFLGGAGTNAASAVFTARFLNASNALLGTNAIGPVTAADRANETGLMERRANGRLPVGTRLIEFVLVARSPVPTNDASADNLSFVLSARPDPPVALGRPQRQGAGWQIPFDSRTNRFYALERTEDFASWTTVSAESVGSGGMMALTDTNAPVGRAFYRVVCRRP